MKHGLKSVLVYDRAGYRMIATDNGWIFEFDTPPILHDVSYALGDGSMLHLDDCITRFAGPHTSAGYRDLHMALGHMRYAGARRDGDSDDWTLLFRWSVQPGHLVYYGFNVVGVSPLRLAFSTPARSSRLIETAIVERVRSPSPAQEKPA